MIKKLLIVSCSGLLLSIVLLSSAWVVGGSHLMERLDKGDDWFLDVSDDEGEGDETAMVTRTLALDTSQPLEIAAPVELRYIKGDTARLTVRGPERLMKGLAWEKGQLSLKEDHWFHNRSLKIEITAPEMPDLLYRGAGDIRLEHIDQPALALEMAGAGNITARGRVQELTVQSRGAGNIDLSELVARDAIVSLAGVGNIDINASGKVDATLSGAGNVSLHRKPAELTSRIHGIGSIDNDY